MAGCSVETSVETSSGEGAGCRKNAASEGRGCAVAAKGDGVVLLCDGGDPWSVCKLL